MKIVWAVEELVMQIKYEYCPYCHSKNVEEQEVKGFIVVRCKDCNNQIDIFEKESK